MRNKKLISFEEEQLKTTAFLQKLESIKKSSKQIKDKNKYAVHKVEWTKEYSHLNKLERAMDQEVLEMCERLDSYFEREIQEYQVFGRESYKSFVELFHHTDTQTETHNVNVWYQVEGLKTIINKIVETGSQQQTSTKVPAKPPTASTGRREGSVAKRQSVQNKNNHNNEEGQATSAQGNPLGNINLDEVTQIKNEVGQFLLEMVRKTNQDQQQLGPVEFPNSALDENQTYEGDEVKGFDLKKDILIKAKESETMIRNFSKQSGKRELQYDEESKIVSDLENAMALLNEKYELEMEKIELDYEEALNVDSQVLKESENYIKLNHIYNCYIGRGKDRGLYMERLMIEFPNISRKTLEILTGYVEAKIYKTRKLKACQRNYLRDRTELIDKAQQQIMAVIEAKVEKAKRDAEKLQRKEESMKLNEELTVLRAQYRVKQEEKARIEAEKKREQEEQRLKEEKLWKEHTEEISKKAKEITEIKEKKRMEEERLKREQQQKERDELAKKIMESKPKIQVRQSLENRKIKEKLENKERAVEAIKEKEMRIEQAIQGYAHRPVVQQDPMRLMQKTESLAQKKVEFDKADKFDLVKVHGYNVNQLMSDMRYKLNYALNQAGLSHTDYAREVMMKMSKPVQPAPFS